MGNIRGATECLLYFPLMLLTSNFRANKWNNNVVHHIDQSPQVDLFKN